MKNNTLKVIIKALAEAPTAAAREALKQLKTEEERNEARRIFAALNILPAEDKTK
jgi:hypothetical protein